MQVIHIYGRYMYESHMCSAAPCVKCSALRRLRNRLAGLRRSARTAGLCLALGPLLCVSFLEVRSGGSLCLSTFCPPFETLWSPFHVHRFHLLFLYTYCFWSPHVASNFLFLHFRPVLSFSLKPYPFRCSFVCRREDFPTR